MKYFDLLLWVKGQMGIKNVPVPQVSLFQKLISNCTNKQTQNVELQMLQDYVAQVRMKIKFYEINQRNGLVTDNRTIA